MTSEEAVREFFTASLSRLRVVEVFTLVLACIFVAPWNAPQAQIDTDGDGIVNSSDIDDDNDGILDTVENVCGTQVTTSWTGTDHTYAGTGAEVPITVSFANDVDTSVSYTPMGTHTDLALFSNPAVQLNTSFELLFYWDTTAEGSVDPASDDAGTATMTISFGQTSHYPVIHIERLGGSARDGETLIFYSNTILFTLVTPGLIMKKLAGNSQFIVNDTQFYREPDVSLGTVDPGGGSSFDSVSTAAGSVQILGDVDALTFELTGRGVEGSGADGIELTFEGCASVDTDQDGIPNYLDLDADNDGISDLDESN